MQPTTSGVGIITDGACSGGIGGWAAILIAPSGTTKELSGAERDTTNNRMELMGVIAGLEAVHTGWPCYITTDSRYVADALNKDWIGSWQRRGWRKSDGDPVKNRDLWERLIAALSSHPGSEVRWVRGHAGHALNERADQLAVDARLRLAAGR